MDGRPADAQLRDDRGRPRGASTRCSTRRSRSRPTSARRSSSRSTSTSSTPGPAPGTGTPEPGGLSTRQLLDAVRRIAMELPVAGIDVVEVSPPYDHAEVTAYLANRVVLEALSGIAWRRRGAGGLTQRDPRAPLLGRGTGASGAPAPSAHRVEDLAHHLHRRVGVQEREARDGLALPLGRASRARSGRRAAGATSAGSRRAPSPGAGRARSTARARGTARRGPASR